MDRKTLDSVATWAEARVNTGSEPPWTEQPLIELATLARQLSQGIGTTITLSNSLQCDELEENVHPQSGNIVQLDSFRCRHGRTLKVQMPT